MPYGNLLHVLEHHAREPVSTAARHHAILQVHSQVPQMDVLIAVPNAIMDAPHVLGVVPGVAVEVAVLQNA